MIATVSATDVAVAAAARRIAFLIFFAATAAACQRPSPSQQLADRFMQLYYGQANAAEAVKLTTGAARQRLEGELQAIAGVRPDSGDNKPEVTFKLTSSTATKAGSATYVYEVVPHTSDVGSLVATLDLVQDGDRWLVSSLHEKHSAP
jgi:hypothetical protein